MIVRVSSLLAIIARKRPIWSALKDILATVAHAVHAGIRPTALLPMEANGNDPFVMALRRIEFKNGRLLQAQVLFLKGPELMPFRSTVLERRHMEIGKLWAEALESIGITIGRSD